MEEARDEFWEYYILLREGLKLTVTELWDYPEAIYDEGSRLLRDAHPRAYFQGRRTAGYQGQTTDYLGHPDAQLLFDDLARFQQVTEFIRSGSLSQAEVLARMSLYARHLVGTANQGWARQLDGNVLVDWVLGVVEENCLDCPHYARQSPYRAADLPTLPGLGATQCTVNCHCFLITREGLESLTLLGEVQ